MTLPSMSMCMSAGVIIAGLKFIVGNLPLITTVYIFLKIISVHLVNARGGNKCAALFWPIDGMAA